MSPKSASKPEVKYGITPQGEVQYAWLDKPDVRFLKSDGDKGKYTVTLLIDPSVKENEEWEAELKKLCGDKGCSHLSRDKETNFIVTKFHSYSKAKQFDSAGHVCPDASIGKGSIVKVAFSLSEYEGFGGGNTLYLNAIQIVKLVEFTVGAKFPPVEDGYIAGDVGEKPVDKPTEPQDQDQPF